MEDGDFNQRLRDLQREYLEFLDDEKDQGTYMEKVKQMIADKSHRLVVSVNDLRRKNPERACTLLDNAFEEQIAFQKALKEYVLSINPSYVKVQEEFFIAFNGSFGNKHVTPRSLTSRFLGNLICVEGIVTRVSLVRSKVVRSVHYCPTTKKVMERKYTDLTSFEAFPTSDVYPTKDDEGNPLELEYGLSRYKDHQTLTVQEMPERAPPGQLPRGVDIICEDDLADKCKPGDRVQIVGSYRCLPSKVGNFTSGTLRTILIANNITQIDKDMNMNITLEDVKLCKKLAKRTTTDIFELLSKSLAPSIHGHDYIKKAILCLLLGGIEKVLPNGMTLRGDINILLIGDPSVAKSQLLHYVQQTAPRAITTTGRGSSGVDLTAAVTTDPETGDRRLEAGAMVLADRGVVCIDHFDKMSDIDRTAIHEVMEQGRVTIAKAGVHATLNARCSVLAAANPVYGRYDQYKTPMENIGLQDSLLSRFDLLFVMQDISDADHDNMISEHVLRMHRYRNPKEKDGEVLPMESTVEMLSTENPDNFETEENNTSIYEVYDPLLHGNNRRKKKQYLNTEFMRKFFHIARLMKPKLTQTALDTIVDEYVRLRNQDMESDVARTQPVTARTLETLIRLSTAHAKCRLSFKITQKDALAAIELVRFAYFKKVLTKEKRPASSDEGAAADEGEQPAPSLAKMSKKTVSPQAAKQDAELLQESENNRPESVNHEKYKTRNIYNKSIKSGSHNFEIDGPECVTPQESQSKSNKRKHESESENILRDASNAINIEQKSDEFSTFGVSIASELREIKSKRHLLMLKKEIMDLVYKTKLDILNSENKIATVPTPSDRTNITKKRLTLFKTALLQLFREERANSLPLSHVTSYVNYKYWQKIFDDGEIQAALEKMTQDNQVMMADDIVFLI